MFKVVELDLSTVVPCCSGPKRPHDRVSVSDMKADFASCLTNRIGFKVHIQCMYIYMCIFSVGSDKCYNVNQALASTVVTHRQYVASSNC